MNKRFPKAPWRAMIRRCTDKNNYQYKDYGARGITVCPEWLASYEKYIEDIGPQPGPGYSIDRIDNSKGYSKENCRWSTSVEQANNKRNNRIIECNGVKKTLAEWGRFSGIDCESIAFRLKFGWDIERAIYTPIQTAKSGVPSVFYRPDRKSWVIKMRRNKKTHFIGTYKSIFDAACARLGNEVYFYFSERAL